MAPLLIVINLSYRTDRKQRITEHLDALGLEYTVTNAVDGQQISESEHPSPPNVAACWLSHQAAARILLNSSNDYAWILEDDAVISTEARPFFDTDFSHLMKDLDIFQIGYNVQKNRVASGYFDRHYYIVKKLLCFFEDLFRNLKFPSNIFCKLHSLEKKMPTQISLIANRYETGTHCYLISRKTASSMLAFNNPVLLPADIAMCELSKTRLKMYRPSKSLVSQNESPSSIPEISNEIFEMRLKKFLDQQL